MKIRTDFVTNSSSSSFVSVIVYTKDENCYEGGFNNDEFVDIQGCDPFEVTESFFEDLKSGEELVSAMKEWFAESIVDPSFVEEDICCDGEIDDIVELDIDNIERVELSSNITCDDFSFANEITYDYMTKTLEVSNTGDCDW